MRQASNRLVEMLSKLSQLMVNFRTETMVVEPGLYSLLVDFGRTGSRSLGVPMGGAADRFALAIGNGLVGNPPDTVGMEVTLRGPTLVARCRTLAVVFGAPFEVMLDRVHLEVGTTFIAEAGQVLRIGGTAAGCRAYLCVAGGFESPLILGSRSAFEPIRTGDHLAFGESKRVRGGLSLDWRPETPSPWVLRTLPGPQVDWFTNDTFSQSIYTVASASNRMGVRLTGPRITRQPGELVSEVVAPGAVQITNDGQPVVLGVDGQTIGGYPKIAHVIRADLDILGRLRPGDLVRFQPVSPAEAEQAAIAAGQELRNWLLRLQVLATS